MGLTAVFEDIFIIRNPKSNSIKDLKRAKDLVLAINDRVAWIDFYTEQDAKNFINNLIHEPHFQVNEAQSSKLSVCFSLTDCQQVEDILKLLLKFNFLHEGDIIAYGNGSAADTPEGLITRAYSYIKICNNELKKIGESAQDTYVIHLDNNDECNRVLKIGKRQSHFFTDKNNEKVETNPQRKLSSLGLSRTNHE